MRCTSATTCTATSSGAREAGLTTVMVDSDQGKKAYQDCVPDYTITDLRELLTIRG
jgi:FMN phosphatase YigB (HAD superfamily)